MSVFGSFTQGVNFADDFIRRQEEDAQTRIDRQRQNAAFDEGVERFGALAGSQAAATTAGTVAGVNQREEMHPLVMRQAEVETQGAEIEHATQAIRRGASLFQQNPEAGAEAIGQIMHGLGYDEDTTGQTIQMLGSGQMTPEQLTTALEEPLTSAQRLQSEQFDQRQQLSREEMASRERIARQRGSGAAGRRPFGAPFRMENENGDTLLVQRFNDGSIEPLGRPGQTASDRRETRISENERQDRTVQAVQREQSTRAMMGWIDSAMGDLESALEFADESELMGEGNDGPMAGLSRRALSLIPTTAESELMSSVSSFRRNAGILNILAVRRSGATLGQIPAQQQIMLEELYGKLEVERRPAELRRLLRRAHTLMGDMRESIANDPEAQLQLAFAEQEDGFDPDAFQRWRREPVFDQQTGQPRQSGGAPAQDDDISDLLNQY